MSMMHTPSLQPGERSLPAELRTMRGHDFAARRLRNGMRGVAGLGYGGLGDDSTPVDIPIDTPIDTSPVFPDTNFPVVSVDPSTIPLTATEPWTPPPGVPVNVAAGQAPPSVPSGFQWVQAANNAGLTLAKVLAIGQGGTVMQLPNGQQVITGSPGSGALALSNSALTGTIGAYLPYLLLAGGLVLVVSLMRR